MPNVFTRLWNLLAGGVVVAIDDSGPVMRLQIKVGYLETHTLPALQQFGFSSVPPVGSDVVAHYIGGDRSNGVVTGTNHQPTRPPGKNPGETMVYDAFGKSIYLTESGGIVVNANGSPVTVNGATVLTVVASEYVLAQTPEFRCTGDIIDNYGVNEQTMAAMRTIYDEHDHKVVDVQTGGATIVTETPLPQM
jgi:phage baseplate assembly protein V